MRNEPPIQFTLHRHRTAHSHLQRAVSRFCCTVMFAAVVLFPGRAVVSAIWS